MTAQEALDRGIKCLEWAAVMTDPRGQRGMFGAADVWFARAASLIESEATR